MNKEDYIDYRKQRAKESLSAAEVLMNAGNFYSAVNRIYYALFYTIEALLLIRDLSSSKHGGVRSFFNRHFVKTGKVSIEIGELYNEMFEFRQKSDYGDYIHFDKEDIYSWLSKSKSYISELDQLIDKELNNPDDAGEKS